MQRCCSFRSRNCITLLRRTQTRPLLYRYATTSTKSTLKKAVPLLDADDTARISRRPDTFGVKQKPNLSLRTLGKLLNGPDELTEEQYSNKAKARSRVRLNDHIRRINGLVASLPLESAVAAVTYVISSASIPDRLRSRILAKASYSFLRHRHYGGAIAMYKSMLSQGFAPPISLVVAIYRNADVRNAHKTTAASNDAIESRVQSITTIDDRLLGMLLSTLEPSKRPDIMETVVQEHASQISHSCLTNPLVVASMIRGYHVAGQLDGCYTWFHRYRHTQSTKDADIPTAPYVCLMAASRKLDPKNTAALYRIAKTMQEDGAPLTTIAFNEILASELQNRRFQRVFSLFSTLSGNDPSLRPDAHTFSLYFDALWKNETGPRFNSSLNPQLILRQMLSASESNPPLLTIFNSNAALRYLVHTGDFRSAITVVDTTRSSGIVPNALTIRWVLEEILKRCQKAFAPTASLELENWVRSLLGGLSRDHMAYTAHLLDVVRSTRNDATSQRLTKATQDALQLIHKALLSRRSTTSLSTKEQHAEAPVFSMIYDVLQVCNNPA